MLDLNRVGSGKKLLIQVASKAKSAKKPPAKNQNKSEPKQK